MPTLQDVAKHAQVSTSTVSRVLSGKGKFTTEVQTRVQNAIKLLDYQPNSNAQALASNRVSLVGFITPSISAPFYGQIASGGEIAARAHKYRTLIANSFRNTDEELEAIRSFQAQGCKNIILHSMSFTDEQLIELANKIDGLVILGRFVEQIANRCVWLDNVKGGQMAAEYLIANGHEDIAILSYAQTQCDPSQRINGARIAFANAGLNLPQDSIIFNQGQIADGSWSVNKLLDSGKHFSAILAYNDLIAVGACKELIKRGYKVPEDVSVIGFDNLFFAEICTPELTTVNYPIKEMASYAVELSIKLTEQPDAYVERTHLFMPSIVERSSVKRLSK
ncbi:LacI family transcriptional regulator [Catenovulum agarivorans DS-2]|uniref:LacI family transcriptional regulator n=1 Tax=Catenovulum agarivorans DS-2 TaxID=1328313 RepID=W7QNU7_9ALTE|nr:LacI family DNA-binding transcriptional regulator [Catenovulum agarivorans]EWH09578.1 LacI family transcriptional regulator [Catenovulum agarivorans DS-2]